jgi:hypothetical protein
MTSFNGSQPDDRRNDALSPTPAVIDMTKDDIQSSLARARDLRAEYLGAWGRRVAQTWAGLFRRPRHLLPNRSSSLDRVVHSTML